MKFNSIDGSYDKERKLFTFYLPYASSFPNKITVEGARLTKEFIVDTEAAYQNEYWDGELCEYKEPKHELGIRVVLTFR